MGHFMRYASMPDAFHYIHLPEGMTTSLDLNGIVDSITSFSISLGIKTAEHIAELLPADSEAHVYLLCADWVDPVRRGETAKENRSKNSETTMNKCIAAIAARLQQGQWVFGDRNLMVKAYVQTDLFRFVAYCAVVERLLQLQPNITIVQRVLPGLFDQRIAETIKELVGAGGGVAVDSGDGDLAYLLKKDLQLVSGYHVRHNGGWASVNEIHSNLRGVDLQPTARLLLHMMMGNDFSRLPPTCTRVSVKVVEEVIDRLFSRGDKFAALAIKVVNKVYSAWTAEQRDVYVSSLIVGALSCFADSFERDDVFKNLGLTKDRGYQYNSCFVCLGQIS
jgi:hypothetical protein